MAWSAKKDSTDVEIRLHPPELGALRVLLKIDGDQVQAQFTAPVAETRVALEQTLPRLRELLAGQGLNLMNSQVFDPQRQGSQLPPFIAVGPGAEAAPEDFSNRIAVRLRNDGLLDEYA